MNVAPFEYTILEIYEMAPRNHTFLKQAFAIV